MMTAKECRAKAADALMRAGEWTAMAVTADIQDQPGVRLFKGTVANDDA